MDEGTIPHRMARLLRLLPDPSRAHEFGSLDPPKITLVSLAAVAERAQSLQRTTPSWRAKVQCSGRRRFTDEVLAHVRTPGGPTSPAQPLFRLTRSSPTLRLRPSLTQSNRRVRTRMPGGGGGVASRDVPLSQSIRTQGELFHHFRRHRYLLSQFMGRVPPGAENTGRKSLLVFAHDPRLEKKRGGGDARRRAVPRGGRREQGGGAAKALPRYQSAVARPRRTL